jgi:hypothetical protein
MALTRCTYRSGKIIQPAKDQNKRPPIASKH